MAVLVGLWLFAVYQSHDVPENASLLYLPVAALVPAFLGAPGVLDESAALVMLGLASAIAGVTVFFSLLGPARWRPIVGGAALGVEFGLLWLIGRGPVIGYGAGAVVPACAFLLIAVTALLTVLAPLGALFSSRFMQTVDEASGGSRAPRAPARGARRSDGD
jgi:hypothetical protein